MCSAKRLRKIYILRFIRKVKVFFPFDSHFQLCWDLRDAVAHVFSMESRLDSHFVSVTSRHRVSHVIVICAVWIIVTQYDCQAAHGLCHRVLAKSRTPCVSVTC